MMLPAILFAVPALIPSIRQRARSVPKARRWLSVGAALPTFAIDYAVFTYVAVAVSVALSAFMVAPYDFNKPENVALSSAAMPEIWLEAMLPLGICYLGQETCATVDAHSKRFYNQTPKSGAKGPVIFSIGTTLILPLSLVAALTSVWLVLRLTRPAKPTKAPLAA